MKYHVSLLLNGLILTVYHIIPDINKKLFFFRKQLVSYLPDEVLQRGKPVMILKKKNVCYQKYNTSNVEFFSLLFRNTLIKNIFFIIFVFF